MREHLCFSFSVLQDAKFSQVRGWLQQQGYEQLGNLPLINHTLKWETLEKKMAELAYFRAALHKLRAVILGELAAMNVALQKFLMSCSYHDR